MLQPWNPKTLNPKSDTKPQNPKALKTLNPKTLNPGNRSCATIIQDLLLLDQGQAAAGDAHDLGETLKTLNY